MVAMLHIIKIYSSFSKPMWKIEDKTAAKIIGLFLQQLN